MIIDVHAHAFESLDAFPPLWAKNCLANQRLKFINMCGDEAKAEKMVDEWREAITANAKIESLIKAMDEAGVDKAVVNQIDHRMNYGEESKLSVWRQNEYIAESQRKYPDRIIGFASVDPTRENAIELLERMITELGLKGLKVATGMISPQDERIQPFWKKVNELELPVLFHSGSSFLPGYIEYYSPVHLDALAIKYPKMKMIAAHCSKGWEEVVIGMILYREGRIAIDISGFHFYDLAMSPWHFILKMRYLMDKIPRSVLMGTDWPVHVSPPYTSYKQWFDIIRNLKIPEPLLQLGWGMKDFSQEEKGMILGENARRFLGL